MHSISKMILKMHVKIMLLTAYICHTLEYASRNQIMLEGHKQKIKNLILMFNVLNGLKLKCLYFLMQLNVALMLTLCYE